MTKPTPPSRPSPTPHLPAAVQSVIVAAFRLGPLLTISSVQLVDSPLASQAGNEHRSDEPGSFRPTKEQWSGHGEETVARSILPVRPSFRPIRATDGRVASYSLPSGFDSATVGNWAMR
jgi:hypothetical protein